MLGIDDNTVGGGPDDGDTGHAEQYHDGTGNPLRRELPGLGRRNRRRAGVLPWTEAASPFAETLGSQAGFDSQESQIVAEAFETLRDEAFDGALAELIAETSEAADARLQGEQPMQLSEQRWQLADAHRLRAAFRRSAFECEPLDRLKVFGLPRFSYPALWA